jgi:hypothetical protein
LRLNIRRSVNYFSAEKRLIAVLGVEPRTSNVLQILRIAADIKRLSGFGAKDA